MGTANLADFIAIGVNVASRAPHALLDELIGLFPCGSSRWLLVESSGKDELELKSVNLARGQATGTIWKRG